MRGKQTLALLALLLVFCPTSQATSPLRIAYPEFAPFHATDENGKLQGFFYDIITEAVQKRLGIPVTWTPYPWIRCQQSVIDGIQDAILTVPTAARAKYTKTHSRPFYEKQLNIFTWEGHPHLDTIRRIGNLADIKVHNLSVLTYSGNGWHEQHVAALGIRTFEASRLENIWHMLALRRGDIVIEWPAAALPDITKQDLTEKIIDTSVVVSSMPFHLLIHKDCKHIELLKKFDTTIDAMHEDGTMARILSSLQ